MLTTIAWYQSVDPAGAVVQLSAVADQSVRVSGADIYCPPLKYCVALAGGAESTVSPYMRFFVPVATPENINVYPAAKHGIGGRR
jgi:hypothetical protein